MRGSKGFTLVEILIVMAIAAVMIAGLASLHGSIARQNGRIVQEVLVRGQADYAKTTILRTVSEATLLQTPRLIPAAASTADEVSGWTNQNPTNITCTPACRGVPSPMVDSLPVGYFRICRTDRGQLVRYWGAVPMGLSLYMPTCVCGLAPDRGEWEVLAGLPLGKVAVGYASAGSTGIFERPVGVTNSLKAAFLVSTQGQKGFSEPSVARVDIGMGLLYPGQ